MSADRRKTPSFLGIGTARAGTTWLHANLRRHPEIWLPPLKELHYFDLQRPGAGVSRSPISRFGGCMALVLATLLFVVPSAAACTFASAGQCAMSLAFAAITGMPACSVPIAWPARSLPATCSCQSPWCKKSSN